MAICLWGGYHTFVFGSGTKLFEIVPGFLAGVPEFETISKVPDFRFFKINRSRQKVDCVLLPLNYFLKMAGC
jgi:hypothetical protein